MRRAVGSVAVLALGLAVTASATVAAPGAGMPAPPGEGARTGAGMATTETEFRRAWADPVRRRIDLGADIFLRDCHSGDPIRESAYPLVLHGHGHTLQQTCFEKRLLRQDGTGFLDIRHLGLTRGGSDGPGAALTSRGEILLRHVVIRQNLAEEPGGGVFSMRRVTVRHSRIDGNLANDDGGGIYARRGGVQVYDSVLSNNLVDGSGGAIGSTGDILVVRSEVDGNTTDGDGGALYTDEDGDITVIDSNIDGSTADGPGGAIFALDGDVAVLGSTLIGNRADDRGGAISGEDDVLLVNSTVARNLAVAHAGGGIWSRGDTLLVNSTVTDNYAEGEGGGVLAAGRLIAIGSTLTGNIAPVGGDLGSSADFTSFASIIGPARADGVTGDTIPTTMACRVYSTRSRGYNFVHDKSCRLRRPTDILGRNPRLAKLEEHHRGFVRVPRPQSPVRRRIPSGQCVGELPERLPAGQLLEAYVEWDRILRHDALGRPRDTGDWCDIGAVQSKKADRRHRVRSASATPWPPVGPSPPSRWPVGSVPADDRRGVTAASQDSPPLTVSGSRLVGPLDRLDHRLRQLRTRLRDLAAEARHFGRLRRCLTEIGVDRAGDVRHRWGFVYDERDGSGEDLRTALVPHVGDGRHPELVLLDLSTAPRCLSRPADPNGSGEDAARLAVGGAATDHGTGPATGPTVGSLLRRAGRLARVAGRVDAVAGRFDEWESCLSWLPVTEAGDREQGLGYRIRQDGASARSPAYLPAVDLDHSEWDDPDYQLLAFLGRDRPFRKAECGRDPGEDVDRPVPSLPPSRTGPDDPDDLDDLRQAVHTLAEDVEDLVEPVAEITRFDECLYTVGLRQDPGYLFRGPDGRTSDRAAWSFDLRGHELPQHSVLAFPGEEPPQIECNEDAAGEDTEE